MEQEALALEWPVFSVALLAPDIPQNVGNIARLCVVSGCELVLVRPLGFHLTDSHLQRSGMDYWKRLNPRVFDDLEDFFSWGRTRRMFALSSKGRKNYSRQVFRLGDVLCFGSESQGLPQEFLASFLDSERLLTIPMVPGERCLNVASSAAIVVYEGIRQLSGWSPPGESGCPSQDVAI